MDNVGVLGLHMELQDFAVVGQELLLGLDSAATELVFEVVHHRGVLDGHIFVL